MNLTDLLNNRELLNGIIVGFGGGHGEAVIQMDAGNHGWEYWLSLKFTS